ncbi:MAG TPA: aminotransferase class I/II-fold pyridoxal phosphate-dependent enzyme [Ktedonobacteraceae bacterium]
MTIYSHEDLAEVQALLQQDPDPFAPPKHLLAFEAQLAAFFHVQEAVAVSSGTAALHCALAAVGIGPGDEVLVPSVCVIMSVVPVLYTGARPVFVDCQPDRVDFDYDDLQQKLSPRTKVILPVHLWGCAYDMERLLAFAAHHHLAIVEDACQAHGATWSKQYLGTWGNIGCFSMRDGKLIETGEGGFLLTNSQDIAQRCRAFRTHWAHFHDPRLSYQHLGQNYRLTEIQALLACKQIQRLPEFLAQRRQQAEYLRKKLSVLPSLVPYSYDAHEESNQFSPVWLIDSSYIPAGIPRVLAQKGVVNSVGSFGLQPAQCWPVFHAHTVCDSSAISREDTPHAAAFLARTLALTLLSHYTRSDLDAIVATIIETFREVERL